MPTSNQGLISNKPYLIRAIYDWLVDNGLTPHMLVGATDERVVVPGEHVKEGRILLNLSPSAVRDLHLGNEMISFSARFSGRAREIFVPPDFVLGIFARENQELGLLFLPEQPATKDADASGGPAQGARPSPVSVVHEGEPSVEDSGDSPPVPPKGPPNLKVVK